MSVPGGDPAGHPPIDHPLAVALATRARFPAGDGPIDCAVSGGADSSALAVLAAVTAAGRRPVTLHHVDHGLRPGSADEAGLVAALAARLGAAFHAHRVDVADGPNLEARARTARQRALPPRVCTGHTADDQAETVLLNLLRGAGTAGLAGMRLDPSAGGTGPTHPLLGIRRAECAELCRALGIVTVDDPSNADARFTRNRVRRELLPLLDDIARRDVVEVLARQAALLRADDDLLDALAADLDPTDARALARAPVPLARRAVRRWLADGDAERHPPDAAAVERVLAVARGEVVACEIPPGRRISRHGGRLHAAPARPACVDGASAEYCDPPMSAPEVTR